MTVDASAFLFLLVGALALLFAVLRVERRRLWAVLVFLVAPVLYLAAQWASFWRRWTEVIAAFLAAAALAGAWWLLVGRRLPPQTSDNIRVWGQEDAPRPRPAEMQAELQRLRAEKARLEAELKRLADSQGGNGQPKE